MAVDYIDHPHVQNSLAGARALVRFDFNVPLQGGGIADTTRLDAALPTIEYLLEHGVSKLVLMGHLGRPKGKVVEELSLRPVGDYLAHKLGQEVIFTTSCSDQAIRPLLGLPKTKIVLLENLRFHSGETQDDRGFAHILSRYGEIYINDAFGSCHRKHASVYGINAFYKDRNFGGLLLKREVQCLEHLVAHPQRPFVAVMGGAKVSDKIGVIQAFLPQVDKLLIGGAMAYPLLAASGVQVGKSLCDPQDVELAHTLLSQDRAGKIALPVDHLASEDPNGTPVSVEQADIPENLMALDIGPKTLAFYRVQLQGAQTIFWNGPMGRFENPHYNKGTRGMAALVARSQAFTVVGGGDSVSAVVQSGLAQELNHISTGGGAALEFIEYKGALPAIRALKFGLEV